MSGSVGRVVVVGVGVGGQLPEQGAVWWVNEIRFTRPHDQNEIRFTRPHSQS
jgi:hypothetical protein